MMSKSCCETILDRKYFYQHTLTYNWTLISASATPPVMIPGAPPVTAPEPQAGGGVILFPPASTTDVPKFPAPIIVPAMSPPEQEGVVGGPTATNPVTNLQVRFYLMVLDVYITQIWCHYIIKLCFNIRAKLIQSLKNCIT